MRVMVIVKASPSSEAGMMPSEDMEKLLIEMGKYNEELVAAGIMQSGDGLKPSKFGVRVRFSGKDRIVTDGPFAETRELVAGYWIWNVASMEEAVEWVKKCPNPMPDESDIEIRPFMEFEDFGEALTPEIQSQEEALRNRLK
ncbi:YciI family protein [bacterium]|nr:YciI family protein [bacterium]